MGASIQAVGIVVSNYSVWWRLTEEGYDNQSLPALAQGSSSIVGRNVPMPVRTVAEEPSHHF